MLEDDVSEIKEHTKEEKSLPISELDAAFPCLIQYRQNRCAENFGGICREIADLCEQLYASTTSDDERAMYSRMAAKIKR